jgi:Mg2+ and Co2+ transporter CorA
MLRCAARVLSEPLMGFLAIVALALALTPLLWDLPPAGDLAIDGAEWAIVALFAVEYVVHFAVAENRRRYALDPMRLLDLATVLLPLASILPQVSDAFRSSPVLRLVRLVRALVLGARAGGVLARERAPEVRGPEPAPLTVARLGPGWSPEPATWLDVAQAAPGTWLHVAGAEAVQIDDLARATGVPRDAVAAALGPTSYPRIEVAGDQAVVCVWLPLPRAGRPLQIDRVSVLLSVMADRVVSASRAGSDLTRLVADALPSLGVPDAPFPARVAYAVLKLMLRRNEVAAGLIEGRLRELEEAPAREAPSDFFERTFELKRELSEMRADLWRLRGILAGLAGGRVRIPGQAPEHATFLQQLDDECDYWYGTVENLRGALLSVIELHINVASYDMNRVMKLLAVISVLGLVPAVVGGLLGMNLAGNPWAASLGQVTFGVGMAMLLCLYVFVVRGWLR